MDEVIDELMEHDSQQSERLRKIMKKEGKSIDDQLLVQMLIRKIQSKECQAKGWIIEDFPKNKSQAT